MSKSVWDVSYELEVICERKFGMKFDHTNTIFDRSKIEKNMFFNVMHLLLHMDNKNGDEASEFIDKHLDLVDVNMNDIPNYEEIYNEFKTLVIV